MIGKYTVFMMTSIGRLDSHAGAHARQWLAHWLFFTRELLKVCFLAEEDPLLKGR